MKAFIVIAIAALAFQCTGQPLPGTKPLNAEGDMAAQMIDGIERFLQRETDDSIAARAARWKRDPSSPAAYQQSIAPNRARLAKMLGVVDERIKFDAPELIATTTQSALVSRGDHFEVYAVRWPVIGSIQGEGLLLVPMHGVTPLADVIALPDADQTPEMIAGVSPGIKPQNQYARILAASGCRVLVPALIDRSDTFSMPPSGQRTNQPHREYIYRPAFQVGRTIIGYEIQKVLTGVDWFFREADPQNMTKGNLAHHTKIGVIGYGEGGLLAMYAAALDLRIGAVCVSGYFGSRQNLWQEPIYRNVFGLLSEFGDAEIASLIAPRPMIIEACDAPHIDGPPPPHDGRNGAAPGRIDTPALAEVRAELKRAENLAGPALSHFELCVSGDEGKGTFATTEALQQFLTGLDLAPKLEIDTKPLEAMQRRESPRLERQIDQMQEFTQSLVRNSEPVRQKFWAKADRSSLANWEKSTEPYRTYFYDEFIGRIDHELLPPNCRTRKIYDEPSYTGYEVMLDVFPDVFAYGILLVPKGIKEGEHRPVVVCQHGLNGRAQDVADPKSDSHFYHRFACQLAEQGFITYAPQNPYIFDTRFRQLFRKAHPIKQSLYSFIVPQHQQLVNWLSTLPFVDPQRVAFYGLSYGGKTAMRIPPLVPQYCLVICSGDFNEWLWKTTSLSYSAGYPGTQEYDMFEWNLGNTFNYAEMTNLIAPRPFMVERGHHDGVGLDEYVAYEYAKVRHLYADLKIAERTTIEFFDGPHTIHGVGTFKFLHEQLNWPERN